MDSGLSFIFSSKPLLIKLGAASSKISSSAKSARSGFMDFSNLFCWSLDMSTDAFPRSWIDSTITSFASSMNMGTSTSSQVCNKRMRGATWLCISTWTLANSASTVFTSFWRDVVLKIVSSLGHLVSWISGQGKPFLNLFLFYRGRAF